MNKYGKVILNANLENFNTYKLKVKVKYLIYPYKDKLGDLLKYLKANNLKYFILGGGSNIIFADSYYDGVFISLKRLNKFTIKNDYVIAESGINLNYLIYNLNKQNYNNMAKLYGIPGSLGGAIVGNAHFLDDNIYNHLISVEYLDDNASLKNITKEELEKDNIFKDNNYLITKVKLKIFYDKNIDYESIVKSNLEKRQKSQPLEYPSAGCMFSNPEGYSAGALIDKECNLKGTSIGGAKVSEKHANFIINYDNATGCDIIKLATYVQKEVKKKTNIELELEQKIIKW